MPIFFHFLNACTVAHGLETPNKRVQALRKMGKSGIKLRVRVEIKLQGFLIFFMLWAVAVVLVAAKAE